MMKQRILSIVIVAILIVAGSFAIHALFRNDELEPIVKNPDSVAAMFIDYIEPGTNTSRSLKDFDQAEVAEYLANCNKRLIRKNANLFYLGSREIYIDLMEHDENGDRIGSMVSLGNRISTQIVGDNGSSTTLYEIVDSDEVLAGLKELLNLENPTLKE